MQVKLSKLKFLDTPSITISFHTWQTRESLVLELSWQGRTGFGEANPFLPITGDSEQDVIDWAKRLQEIPLDPTKDSPQQLHQFLQELAVGSLTFRAALDFAYHDLLGQIQQRPVFRLYADKPHFVRNCVTVFLQPTLEETQQEARRILSRYPHLQLLKIKLAGTEDVARCRAIGEVASEFVQFVLDANQGYSDPYRAVTELSQIQQVLGGRVIALEEPCAKGDLDKMKYVKDHVKKMLVLADESAATYQDALKIVEYQAAHGVNIKLQKAGGIWPGKQIAELCHQQGLKIMVGAMIEGPFAIAAGGHFVASTPGVLLSDLDTDLDLLPLVEHPLAFADGKRLVAERPGLGVCFNQPHLQDLVAQKKVSWEVLSCG